MLNVCIFRFDTFIEIINFSDYWLIRNANYYCGWQSLHTSEAKFDVMTFSNQYISFYD